MHARACNALRGRSSPEIKPGSRLMSYRGKSLDSCTRRVPLRAAILSRRQLISTANFKPTKPAVWRFPVNLPNQLVSASAIRVLQNSRAESTSKTERERGGGRGEERRVVIILIREYNAWSRRVPLSRAVDRIVSPAFRDFGAARRSIQPASRKPRYICPIRSVPRSFMRVARAKRRQAGRFVNANLDPHGRRLTRFRWLLSRLRASVPPRERPFEPRYEHQRVTARRYGYPDSGGGVRVERRRRHPDRTDAWRL